MKFTLDYPPSLNRLYRNVRGMTLLSREGREYKKRAGFMALQQRVRPLAGPLCVVLRVFRPQRRGDLDNSSKALLDSLNGIAWGDDSQIVELHMFREDDKDRPRAEIEVTQAAPSGDNQGEPT